MQTKRIATATADYRTYEPEILDDGDGEPVVVRLCEELVEGRWEAFVSCVPWLEAQQILIAAGYVKGA